MTLIAVRHLTINLPIDLIAPIRSFQDEVGLPNRHQAVELLILMGLSQHKENQHNKRQKEAEKEFVPNFYEWESQIPEWLASIDNKEVSLIYDLFPFLGIPREAVRHYMKMRAGEILRGLGWQKYRHGYGQSRETRYRRPRNEEIV